MEDGSKNANHMDQKHESMRSQPGPNFIVQPSIFLVKLGDDKLGHTPSCRFVSTFIDELQEIETRPHIYNLSVFTLKSWYVNSLKQNHFAFYLILAAFLSSTSPAAIFFLFIGLCGVTSLSWRWNFDISSSWWLNQPIWKICLSPWIIFANHRGENSKKIDETTNQSCTPQKINGWNRKNWWFGFYDFPDFQQVVVRFQPFIFQGVFLSCWRWVGHFPGRGECCATHTHNIPPGEQGSKAVNDLWHSLYWLI